MSDVSGVTLITRCAEAMTAEEICDDLNKWLEGRECEARFKEVSDHYGGPKHPQQNIFGCGWNHLDPDLSDFLDLIYGMNWQLPESVVLIVQNEEGPALIYRVGDETQKTMIELFSL